MPTRKDKTNVAPIHREQVFIPASGATLMKQKARPKVAGKPVSSGAIEIISPEFDLLTGARGLFNMIKPNKVYANIGNGSNMTMFDGATTTNEAVKQGIKEARDYVRHPVIVETVERNKELAERISGKPARNMGWFTDGNRVPANTRAEVLQHYIDRPVHIQTSNDLPKGFLGDYTSANTKIRVKSGLNPYDTKRVVFHEGLHHSGYGNFEGGLYDLKAEKLFGIDDYLLGHEAAVNTAELGRMMGLKLGQKYPGVQTFKDMIAKYNVDGFDKKFIFDKAILNTPRDYKRFWDALTGKYFTTAGAATTGLTLTNTDKMKCGGRRKAQLGLDIREGGIAIPIAPNMYYMDGRSHDNGGIAIGPNNKNGLEVEGGEVVKVGKNDVKVFSSVPLLRGTSPAELVLGGANPDAVFKAQEEFKDRNRINDDGTTYEVGGEKNISINNLPSSFRGRKIGNSYYQIGIPPSTNKIKSGVTGFKNYLKGLNDDLDEFGVTFTQVSKKVMPKPLRDSYAKIVNAIYKTNKIDKINTAANQIGTASMATDKKKFGGSMIYEINGNVRNGLSLRPKAKYGKIDKKDKDTKVGQDGLIYKRAADGEWYTDGTKHVTYKPITKNSREDLYYANPVQGLYHDVNDDGDFANVSSTIPDEYETITRKFDKPKRTYVGGYDEEEKETKKIGSLTYEKNESGKWVPASKQSTTITRDGGRPKDFGMTRTGVNHPNGSYKYHPLTGEKISEMGVVETSEPSLKGTTKVSSKSSSTARGRGTKTSTPKAAKTITKGADVKYGTPLKEKKESLYMTGIKNNSITPLRAGMEKIKSPSSTGGGTQSKDGRWIGQYKTTNVGDWIGLGSNLAGSVASYFMTKNTIDKMPEPLKPVMAQAAKLKTRYNIEPQLTNVSEAEQMNRATVRRNTQSSNTSLAREQRLMNEARGARNTLYGQKENIETQLINQDKLNRQSVMRDNIRTYNEYLNRLTATKTAKNQLKVSNINNLISGLTNSVNSVLGNIESRRATNNTLRAIAAANPNVDARLIGGFDYYIDPITKKKYNKNQQYVGTING